MWLGSFSKDEGDGDGIENAYIKINSRFFRLWRIYSKWLKITNVIFFKFFFQSNSGGLNKRSKEKEVFFLCAQILHKTSHNEISRCGGAGTAKKCTKMRAAGAKFVFTY